MDFAKFLLLMLYLFISAWVYYILSNEDCKESLFFLKILMLLIFFEGILVLMYDSPCEAFRQMCGNDRDA